MNEILHFQRKNYKKNTGQKCMQKLQSKVKLHLKVMRRGFRLINNFTTLFTSKTKYLRAKSERPAQVADKSKINTNKRTGFLKFSMIKFVRRLSMFIPARFCLKNGKILYKGRQFSLNSKIIQQIRKTKNFYKKAQRQLKVVATKRDYWSQIFHTWMILSKPNRRKFIYRIRDRAVYGSWVQYDLWYYRQKLNKKLKHKYFKVKKLRFKIFSRFPPSTYYRLKKFEKPGALTKQEIWLTRAYSRVSQQSAFNVKTFTYKKQKWKKVVRGKTDFFQTLLGWYFIFAQVPDNVRRFRVIPKRLRGFYSKPKVTKRLKLRQKLGWYYTNLTYMKYASRRIFERTKKVYPYVLLSSFWRAYKKAPWLEYLQSKSHLYAGRLGRQRRELKWLQKFAWIPYLRKKKPFFQKKNQLYKRRNNLLFSYWTRGLIKKKKMARIKNILSKTILPFYGHLNQKQFISIKKKVQRKKTKHISRDDLFLGHFERRLDVVVYRLNLAPTIYWARKLITDGAVFLCSIFNKYSWDKLHAPLKKFHYPLKLRDPLNLYKKTVLAVYEDIRKINKRKLVFLPPLTQIDYLVKPGEIIQCAPGASLNQFKTNHVLWKKPIPKHFLHFSDLTETQKDWQFQQNKISAKATSVHNHTIVATIIFPPSYDHLLKSDRVNRQFLNWIAF